MFFSKGVENHFSQMITILIQSVILHGLGETNVARSGAAGCVIVTPHRRYRPHRRVIVFAGAVYFAICFSVSPYVRHFQKAAAQRAEIVARIRASRRLCGVIFDNVSTETSNDRPIKQDSKTILDSALNLAFIFTRLGIPSEKQRT